MNSTHDFITYMKTVPRSTTNQWYKLKKMPIWTFSSTIHKIHDSRTIRDTLRMSERDRRRAWKTVFLYQNIIARLVHYTPKTIRLKNGQFYCVCNKLTDTFFIGRDGYVTCNECQGTGTKRTKQKKIVLEP